MTARRCTGAILAGGRAVRMGGKPKGLEVVGGRRIIDRVADALREATDDLLVVANEPSAPDWLPGVRVVADLRPGHGPASGVHAALTAAASDVLVVAWDAPFVPGGLLRTLRDEGEARGAAFVAPDSASPWGFEPLCAWYGHESLGAVEAILARAGAGIGGIAATVPSLRIDASSWGAPDAIFMTVNTPDDLDRAEQLARGTR
jgi:molybdopterin-guanine dinucleotide biosynthesis protein A